MPDQKPLSPEQLGELYPHAKTYDEKLAERAEIDALKERRKPKLITVRASLLLTLGGGLILATAWLVPIVFGFSIMAGTFAAVLLLIGLVWLLKWIVARIIAIYEINGCNPRIFLLVYCLVLGVFVAAWYVVVGWRFLSELPLAALFLASHFLITLSVAVVTRKIGHL